MGWISAAIKGGTNTQDMTVRRGITGPLLCRHTFPRKSNRLKIEMSITGIQEPSVQLTTSVSMPGNKHRVTK